jgi:hypothetical protein
MRVGKRSVGSLGSKTCLCPWVCKHVLEHVLDSDAQDLRLEINRHIALLAASDVPQKSRRVSLRSRACAASLKNIVQSTRLSKAQDAAPEAATLERSIETCINANAKSASMYIH